MFWQDRPHYYVLDGKEPRAVGDVIEWARWFEATGDRRVAYTELDNGLVVSTVFLGIDHAFDEGPPILFETMVFGDYGGGEVRRYSTWAEAELGHMEMVEALSESLAGSHA